MIPLREFESVAEDFRQRDALIIDVRKWLARIRFDHRYQNNEVVDLLVLQVVMLAQIANRLHRRLSNS